MDRLLYKTGGTHGYWFHAEGAMMAEPLDLFSARLERRLAATERELLAARAALDGIVNVLEAMAVRSGNAGMLWQLDGVRAAGWGGAVDVSERTRPSYSANVEMD